MSGSKVLNRKWKLFVVNHSHIDVGYTDCQERIAAYHKQFISQAVQAAVIDHEKKRDESSRFKFTIEGFWALEQFWKDANATEKDRLLDAIKEEQIELGAFYLHFCELLDQGHLEDSLKPARQFADEHGLRLDVAMGSDINGFSWGMSEALYNTGVRYLMMNINTHHGGCPFKPLVPFQWQTPQGNRILVWNGFPYHKANLLGLIAGWNPDIDPGIPGLILEGRGGYVDVTDISLAEEKIFPLLRILEENDYPYDFLPVMGSALYTDNSPVSDSYCDVIEQWNQVHGDSVTVTSSTLKQFFMHLEQNVQHIPVYSGDWTDWWSDGAISTPTETALFRQAQRTKRLIERLDPNGTIVTPENRQAITQNLLLYAEHTWGHSHCFVEPWDNLVQRIHLRKMKYAIEADELANTALYEVLQARGEGDFTARRPNSFLVINPMEHFSTSIARLHFDGWESEFLNRPFVVVDDEGRSYPHQISTSKRGKAVAVALELDGHQERKLFVKPIKVKAESTTCSGLNSMHDGFENPFYSIRWNERGGIVSLIDKSSDQQLLKVDEPPLGSPVYQVFPGGQRGEAAGFMSRARKVPRDEKHGGRCMSSETIESGEVFHIQRFTYRVAGASIYQVNFTFYKQLPSIDIQVRLTKDLVTDPEGMYVSFPMDLPGGQWYIDKAGAAIRPGIDQLPNTCRDYYMVQAGAALVGTSTGVIIGTPDAPMIHIGGLNLWSYDSKRVPKGTLYSWLTNNKWETNFKATCEGHYEFNYQLSCGKNYSDPNQALAGLHELLAPFVTVRS
ncbi:alpha-mannosidase [Paenibacillus sp. CCS19]|uniref:glycoside hydrolase family 38 N-terminal domain-containing protein n=1 Tax=Paenibacillus sp. CCS19 TaxID=3158387 RepID=UPI00256E18EF|nr:hypothetical protein [Paenibacillus cellulosilyticus]GMK37290.1 alpha-mannosidase [Paenibacillus cellulosilyticus]